MTSTAPATSHVHRSTRPRRCISRSCGRYFSKVETDADRCDSCGRLLRWSPTAWFYVATKKLRRRR